MDQGFLKNIVRALAQDLASVCCSCSRRMPGCEKNIVLIPTICTKLLLYTGMAWGQIYSGLEKIRFGQVFFF